MTESPLREWGSYKHDERLSVLLVALMDSLGLKDVRIPESKLHEVSKNHDLALLCEEVLESTEIRLRLVTRKEADRIVAEAEKAGRETA